MTQDTNVQIRRAKGAQALIAGAGLSDTQGFSIDPKDLLPSAAVSAAADDAMQPTQIEARKWHAAGELPDSLMINIDDILPNHMNARYDDMQLPSVEVVSKGPRVDADFDVERYNGELIEYYRDNEKEIARLCKQKGSTLNVQRVLLQHMQIAQLAYSILKEGQSVPAEVYFSQAHGKYIATKGHRRRLALSALKETRPLWAVVRKATDINNMYLHLAGVIGNEQYMPSSRDTLYAMLMAMREASDLNIEVNYHFVLSHMPTSSPGLAKLIAMMFTAAQRDQTGYLWNVIQRRVFSNASQYAAVVAGCGSDSEAICEAVKAFEAGSGEDGQKQSAGRPLVRVGKREVDRWKRGLERMLTNEGQEVIRQALAKGKALKNTDIQEVFAALIDE